MKPPNNAPEEEPANEEAGIDPAPIDDPRTTVRLRSADYSPPVHEHQLLQALREQVASERPALEADAVALYVSGMAEPLIVDATTDIILGRFDPAEAERGSVDLTPYNAYLLGVSRQHAALRRRAGVLELVDLESTNGTRLNGEAIAPGKPYPLTDGDEIALGELVVRVYC